MDKNEIAQKYDEYKGLPGFLGVDFGYIAGSEGKTGPRLFCTETMLSFGEASPSLSVMELGPSAFEFPLPGGPRALERATSNQRLRSDRLNPLQPGISVSHPGQGSGTLGALVIRQDTGELAVLGSAHVLAGQFARKGDPIFQPGVLDDGDPELDTIGYLEDWFIDEDGDAAIAVLNRSRMVRPEVFGTDRVITFAAEVKLGEILTKSGRGSEEPTSARVDGVGRYKLTLNGEKEPVEVWGFRLVPLTERPRGISEPGDSGAVWYRDNGSFLEGVGLHIDGDRPGMGEEFAIACHLPVVLDRLKVRLLQPGEHKEKRKAVLLPEEVARVAVSMMPMSRTDRDSVLGLIQRQVKDLQDKAKEVRPYP